MCWCAWTWALSSTSRRIFEEEEERETILDKVVLRKVYNKGFCFNTLDKKPELVRKTSGILCAGLAIYDAWLFLKKGKLAQKIRHGIFDSRCNQ